MTPGPAGVDLAECVVNISEGRDQRTIGDVAAGAGECLLDVHSDADHHRTVLTLAGPLEEVSAAARGVAERAVSKIDLTRHRGVHPRLGAVDVVPFVPLVDGHGATTSWDRIVQARNAFAAWAGSTLSVPCFLYGPERTLPDLRRGAFGHLHPDTGPDAAHPTAGAIAVGARPVLIAYNLWIDGPTTDTAVRAARELARRIRRHGVRTLGLAVGDGAQVSCNVVDPDLVTLPDLYDAVAGGAASYGCTVRRGELVGLMPGAALRDVPPHRRAELGVRGEDTIESRLAARMV